MKKSLKTLSEVYVNFTLRNKFIIPAVILMFISFLIVGIWLLRDQRTRHEARLHIKAEQITDLLLSSNLESIWDVDRETLERNCRAFFEDQELARLVKQYNDTPRKCLNYRTPNEIYQASINRVALQT